MNSQTIPFSGKNYVDWSKTAEIRLNTRLHYHTHDQMVGPCPECGGTDRFVVFADGNYWCRQCNRKGWWSDKALSAEELEEAKKKRELYRTALFEQMHNCTVWKNYHDHCECEKLWGDEGFDRGEVNKWGLGVCESCPLVPEYRSLTIPVFYHGRLWDIRHRLIGSENGNKYRSHLPGLTPLFFNLDSLHADNTVYFLEGEKKTIKAVSASLKAVVGYPGIEFRVRLVDLLNRKLKPSQRIVFVPDPDSIHQIVDCAKNVKTPCYLAELWMKPDDLIMKYGTEPFLEAISLVRKI